MNDRLTVDNTLDPPLECDLVMKGGVTSGLVYPPAVRELARTYRIRNIGGASAGAVAAALTAAAERSRATGGYDRLETARKRLQQPHFLRNLFQGNRITEPLLDLVTNGEAHLAALKKALAGKRGFVARAVAVLRWLSRTLKDIPPASRYTLIGTVAGLVIGVVIGAALFGIISLFANPGVVIFVLLAIVFGALVGWLGSYVGKIVARALGVYGIATVDVPGNLFGICSGLNDPANPRYGNHVAATEWLRDEVEAIAGRGPGAPLLTFGELKGYDKERPITLQFVTTDVSDGRPYVLPFDEPFIFRRSEFQRLFPHDVVEAFIAHARTEWGISLPNKNGENPEYLFVPPPNDWPVVVAARMSMSFPMFFSSAPLYKLPHVLDQAVRRRRAAMAKRDANAAQKPAPSLIDRELSRELELIDDIRREGDNFIVSETQLVPHWFSDGGIASNFPIHFFDGWLPTRPTFGITLRYTSASLLQKNATPQQRRATEAYMSAMGDRGGATFQLLSTHDGDVWLPRADQSVPAEWTAIHDPALPVESDAAKNFLLAVVSTMQNYRDNMQAALPSYRERVVQVRLGPDEGGFNLDMDEKKVAGVVAKGKRAGTLLRPPIFNLEHHQWVRMRMLFSRVERALRSLKTEPAAAQALVRAQAIEANRYPYFKPEKDWCDKLILRSDELLDLPARTWKDDLEDFDSDSTLRVTPHP